MKDNESDSQGDNHWSNVPEASCTNVWTCTGAAQCLYVRIRLRTCFHLFVQVL